MVTLGSISITFPGVILDAVLDTSVVLPWSSVVPGAAARRWPGKGKGSLQNPTLEIAGDDLIRPASCFGMARRIHEASPRPPRLEAFVEAFACTVCFC